MNVKTISLLLVRALKNWYLVLVTLDLPISAITKVLKSANILVETWQVSIHIIIPN